MIMFINYSYFPLRNLSSLTQSRSRSNHFVQFPDRSWRWRDLSAPCLNHLFGVGRKRNEKMLRFCFGQNESREGKELMFHLPAWSENIIVNVHSLSLNLLVINDYSLFLHLAMIMSITRRFCLFSRRIYLRSLMFNAFVVFINLKNTTKINFNRLLHPFVLSMII